VETVTNAPIRGNTPSYPGTPLQVGSSGPNVVVIQTELNRISQNYPAIPKIPAVDGVFGSRTEAAVRRFQEIFNLTPDGIVGKATWYALVRLYTAVTSLGELRSLGQQFYAINWSPPGGLQPGDTGEKVRLLQYMLSVLSEFIPGIPPVTVDGIYGSATRSAVLAAQRRFNLPETGTVGTQTWNEIYDQYSGIENTALRSAETFPVLNQSTQTVRPAANMRRAGQSAVRPAYAKTTTLTQFSGTDLAIGSQDPVRQEVVR
jgi:peptidoglycan hydrolase-like protein with peptidoglycan-binding domain